MSLPCEFESEDMAKHYFKRHLPERQSRLKARGLWKLHDCPSASKTIITEVQSRLYKMVLMKVPFDVDVGGGRLVPYVISVSSATQMQQLSADGWTRVLHTSYSANTAIPKGIRNGNDFVIRSIATDVLREKYSEFPRLAPEEIPIIRVAPNNSSWWSTHFKGKRIRDFYNFWANGDDSYLPAKDWTPEMMKVVDFRIDTYKLICQAICILHHPSINFDPDIMSMVFTTTFFRFHRLITDKILTLPRVLYPAALNIVKNSLARDRVGILMGSFPSLYQIFAPELLRLFNLST